jgi:tetratricopeptide (TPR) repeat protein
VSAIAEPLNKPSLPALAAALDALRIEEFETGCRLLSERIEGRPDDAESWAYLTGALLALGRPLEAQEASERALAADQDGFAPNLKAAELALRLGVPARAEQHGLAALRAARPGSRDGAAARAVLAEARGRMRRGVDRRAELPSRLRRPDLLAGGRAIRGALDTIRRIRGAPGSHGQA